MLSHWDHHLKVGIVHPMAFPEVLKGEGPVVPTLKRIAEDDFFSAVDVTWVKDAAARKEAAVILKGSALQANFAAQCAQLVEKADLNHEDPAERKRAVDLVCGLVDQALELGASSLSILSGKDPGDPAKRPDAMGRLVESTLAICDRAKRAGSLPIALKVFDRDVEKKCLVGPAPLAREYALKVRRQFPSFGLCHDLSHIPLLEETPLQALKPIAEFLVQAHMGNCVKDKAHPQYGDQHPIFGLPGSVAGAGELASYLGDLFEVGFLGGGKRPFVGFEMKPHPGITSEIVLSNAKRTLKEAWAILSRRTG